MLKKQLLYIGLFLFATSSAIEAIRPVTDLSLVGGWRRDQVKTGISAESPRGVPFLNDQFSLKQINIWEVGVQGQFAIPNLCRHPYYDWLTHFYFNGNAYWGWGDAGRVNQNIRDLASSSSYSTYSSTIDYSSGSSSGGGRNLNGEAHDIRSFDYSVGFGWQYEINEYWGISPTVGYAWNKLTSRTKHPKRKHDAAHSSDESYYAHSRDELHYSSEWKGPWLGYDLAYQGCDWRFNTGYEYHWARWRGAYTLPDDILGDCGGFSDRRHAKDKYGNVFFVNGWYDFCYNWEFGFGFKYTYFKTGNGSESPRKGTLKRLGCNPDEFDRIKSTRWISYEVTVTLGYLF